MGDLIKCFFQGIVSVSNNSVVKRLKDTIHLTSL